MRRRVHLRKVVYFAIILVLLLVMIVSGLRILESTVFSSKGQETPTTSKTIVRDGVEYFPRQDLTIVMLMGIDQMGPVQSSGSYNNGGDVDMVALLLFDHKAKNIDVLCLNRDTMVDMPVLGLGGKPAGTKHAQLALSHTYGSGLEDSCENTRKTVSDLLYGVQIDYYVSMNMDAIAILNDAVGGVTVTVEDDFSLVDPSISMGEITLHGEQALNFVRTRKDVGDQLNVSRMGRHEQFMQGFLKALNTKREQGEDIVTTAYEQVADYIVSDCPLKTVASMLDRYGNYTIDEIVSPEGENVQGERYYEFHLDEQKLDELILRLLYAPKSK